MTQIDRNIVVNVLVFILISIASIPQIKAQDQPADPPVKQDQSIPRISPIYLSYSDATYQLSRVKTTAGLEVGYNVLDQTIATIDGASLLTIHKAGTTKVVVSQEGNDFYNPAPPVEIFLTITKANQTITPFANIILNYGDAPYQLPIIRSSAGLIVDYQVENGNIATLSETQLLTIRQAGSTYIKLTQAGDDNYNKTTVYVWLEVSRASLTVYIANKSKIYGDPTPPLTIDRIEGFRYDDTETDLTAPVSLITSPYVDQCTPAGIYHIEGYGANSPNYTIDYIDANFTIEKAKMTIYAIDRSKEYGDPNGVYSTIGAPYGVRFEDSEFKCDNSPSVLDLLQLSTTTPANLFSYVGEYPITAGGAASSNYWFEYVPATFTIYKAPLLLTTDTLVFEYGECKPQYWTYTSRGFKLNDWTQADPSFVDRPIFTTTASLLSSVGEYPISLSGATSINYDISYGPDAIIRIVPAPLVVHTESTSKLYGDPDPLFGFTVMGYKNNEKTEDFIPPTPYGYTNSPITADVGSKYPIGIANFDPGINYTFTLDPGYLLINKAPLNVWPLWTTREPLSLNPIIPFYCEGFKLGQDSLVLDRMPLFETSAIYLSPEGDYPSYLIEGDDNNYEFVVYPGRFTVKWIDKSQRHSSSAAAHIWPNPVRETLQIDADYLISRVVIYDMQGSLCQIIEGDACLHPIRLHNTNRGIYLLKAYSQQQETSLIFEVY